MRTILITNSNWSLPLLLELEKKKNLAGIVLADTANLTNSHIKSIAQSQGLAIFEADGQNFDELESWLVKLDPEVCLCLAFPYKIPPSVFNIPKHGIINYHFGSLPEYAGGDPVYWTLRDRNRTAAVSIHQMEESFDSGYVYFKEQLSIFPGENHGLLGARLGQLSSGTLDKLFFKLKENSGADQASEKVKLRKKPTEKALTIDWTNDDAEEVEALVNAANPAYGGAITYYKGTRVQILEVTPADVNNAALLGPGTVVHADAQNGIFVLCADYRFLRINILKTPECILTGNKLAALGIKQGDKFGQVQSSISAPKILL
ncbi:MAG: formyltransferase family protein [Bacteroidota bacterium]